MGFLLEFAAIAWQTTLDVLPIVSILLAFQVAGCAASCRICAASSPVSSAYCWG